jgi:basic membrane lipoprotein Med (substrate-binding protein (PBP1-ABC) superfamily)
MRFKRIALFFILFANIIFLAHSIIPHHHHNGLVVSVASIKSGHNNDKSFNDHSHDIDDDANCALREEILIPGRSFRFAANQQEEDKDINTYKSIHNSIPLLTNPSDYLSCFSFRIHNDISQYLFVLNKSQGLRAPPLS